LSGAEVACSRELSQALSALCPRAQLNLRDAVSVSGKLFTARASALALDLACELVSRCFGQKLASSLSASLGIDWSGELAALDIVTGPLIAPPNPNEK
jgi:transcriptional regulator GlxA family with amidase domain